MSHNILCVRNKGAGHVCDVHALGTTFTHLTHTQILVCRRRWARRDDRKDFMYYGYIISSSSSSSHLCDVDLVVTASQKSKVRPRPDIKKVRHNRDAHVLSVLRCRWPALARAGGEFSCWMFCICLAVPSYQLNSTFLLAPLSLSLPLHSGIFISLT